MKKLIALLVLVFAPAIVAEESVQLKKIKEEFYRHKVTLERGQYSRDCKLFMLGQAMANIEWRNSHEIYAQTYSEKSVALQGIHALSGWMDTNYMKNKYDQSWEDCISQRDELDRFVEDLYDNEEEIKNN